MIWFTVLLLISAKADEDCEKKIGKIVELACSKKPLDIGTAEIRLDEDKEKQRKANIGEMVIAFKKKIRSLERPNADFLLFLSLAEQEIEKGKSPSYRLLFLKHGPNKALSPYNDNFEKDKAALEACIETKKAHRNIRVPEPCANLLAQVLTERAHRKLFYNYDPKKPSQNLDLELEVELRETSLYKKVLKSQRFGIISEDNRIYKKFDEAIEATLVDVKKTMKDFMSKPSIIQNEKVRKKMQEKIGRIKFEGSSCLSEDNGSVAYILMRQAGYNVKKETFIYCRGMVDGRRISEYQLVRTISHELAHSIDPCRIQFNFQFKLFPVPIINYKGSDNPEKTYPFPIIECLRSEDSIKAFRPDYSSYSYSFCHDKDQINESFCDWLAAEILFRHMNSNSKLSGNNKNQHINGIASILRSSCDPEDGLGPSKLGQDTGSHPATIDRLERILLAHPGIRRKLCGKNVKSEVKYCDPTINRSGDSGKKKSSSSTQ